MHSLLRVRGGAASRRSTAVAFSSSSAASSDNEKSQKIMAIQANQALQSIQYCVKMCFFSVFSSVFITFIDGNILSKFLSSESFLGWADYVEFFDSLGLLFFGGGLWRVSQLYYKSFTNPNKRMGQDNLLDLFHAMSWIWGIVAFNLAFVSVFMAASLPVYGFDGPFQFMLEKVSPKQLSMGVVGILGIVSIVILGRCEKRAIKEGRAYREKKYGVQQETQLPTTPKFDKVRQAGFRAYCNQALCAGSFGVMATVEWIRWIVSIKLHIGGGSIIGHMFSVSDFITPFVITALLVTLNRAFVRAAIAEIVGDSAKVDGDDEIFNDLFVAQTRFYNEAAKTVKTATIFSLLPYIIAPAIPFLSKALEKISPSLFEKTTEVFGIEM